ncbi:type II secretion system F family protein [Branchiibius sp. NY16-3462-2]|uniref:type II secretion system F family protein n=1 Tax=Branchiibius sp. NY16-3462-2 TaxID=1807500 RepID=UPI00079997C3|nr:type II secretion system F family protein [Branchiibius sp. NY16-3462-2]KYH45607.1 hypothetical protein AZH51_17965 [Branchiibius sp. NY16-3462-2]
MSVLLILGGSLASICLFALGIREFAGTAAARRRAVIGAEGVSAADHAEGLIDDADRRLRQTRLGRWLESELDLAGIDRKPVVVLLAGLAVGLVATWAVWNFLAPALAVFGLVVGALGVRWYLRRGQARRREAFVAQLPDLARVLANASYAGLSLPTAIAIAGDELSEPARTELSRVATRLKFGAPLPTALEGLRTRVGSREAGVLISTLVVASRSGGSLVTALRNIADTLEQRKETRREIRTTLAQSVATAYMVIVIGAGSLLLLNFIEPGTVQRMTTSLLGQVALVVAALLFGGGYLLIRHMTRIDS